MTRRSENAYQDAIDSARKALGMGVLGYAEAVGCLLTQEGVRTFELFSMLAETYDQLGMHEAACAAAREALALSPNAADMIALLNKPPREVAVSSTERYLIIKAWGEGLWSDVTHVLGCCLICEMTGRVPVTDWGANSRFTDGSEADAFRLLFEPLSPCRAADLNRLNDSVFPARWAGRNLSEPPSSWKEGADRTASLQFLHRPESVAISDFHASVAELAQHIPAHHPMAGQSVHAIYRYLASRYLKVRPDIQAEAKAFYDARLAGPGAVAIHLRGSDKAIELTHLDQVNTALLEAASGFDPSWRIFVMSDDQRWIDRAVARYGERVVSTPHRRTSGTVGLHMLEGDGAALGREVVIDCCIALYCNRFAGLGFSNVAAMVDIMKDWEGGAVLLMGASILTHRHLGVYTYGLEIGNS